MKTLHALLIAITLAALMSPVANAQTTPTTTAEGNNELRALLATPGDAVRGKKAFPPVRVVTARTRRAAAMAPFRALPVNIPA